MSIYHLVWESDWRRDGDGVHYRPPSLAAEGFIHCTRERFKVVEVANLFFVPPRSEKLLLLTLDESRIGPKVIDEDPGCGWKFPHIYGPLEVAAVEKTEAISHGRDGWKLPEG